MRQTTMSVSEFNKRVSILKAKPFKGRSKVVEKFFSSYSDLMRKDNKTQHQEKMSLDRLPKQLPGSQDVHLNNKKDSQCDS